MRQDPDIILIGEMRA